ncbi:hypothetical protein [Nocardia callitridis]|uniref:Uncharacterized protein n=1 Tax=Nocardia callitridis TaxID=648753 RepID=A0ABP9JUX2_9NOCA
MTPEQEAVLRDIQVQLRGPGLSGWPELGADTEGQARGLVEGLSAALAKIGELADESTSLRAQVGELRTEISELEATTADLVAQVRHQPHLPWPFSLLVEGIEGVAELVAQQVSRVEAVLTALLPEGSEKDRN